MVLGPARLNPQILAIFAGLMNVTNRQTDRHTHRLTMLLWCEATGRYHYRKFSKINSLFLFTQTIH